MNTGLKLRLICLGLLLVLLLFYLLSTLGNGWLSYDGVRIGLWKICSEKTGCKTMQHSPAYLIPFLDWFSAVRAFMVLSCIFICLAIILLICNMFDQTHFKMKPVRVLTIFCAIFLIIGVIVFGVERKSIYDSSWSYGWTFYIACVSLVFTVIVVVILYRIHDDKKSQEFSRNSLPMSHHFLTQQNTNDHQELQIMAYPLHGAGSSNAADQPKDNSYSTNQQKDNTYSTNQQKDNTYSTNQQKDNTYSTNQVNNGTYSTNQQKGYTYSTNQPKDDNNFPMKQNGKEYRGSDLNDSVSDKTRSYRKESYSDGYYSTESESDRSSAYSEHGVFL